ncbi:acyl carrier protein [Culicoidibacter larvae]|uniref:Acyl carrier protein n=1 Tax=Culicoidibacter larvae TaxID=2579976 RepID=A0A5R8QGG1_9FIRM|nr:acyl carrier protein [Culicoidibacter larvae]TLG77062.1 acyl carrier protein [Culicoidibacter larvae]
MTTFDKVKAILVDQLGVDPEEVTMDSKIQDDLGADSLSVMQVVMDVEAEFGIEVPEEELLKIVTVGDIVNKIDQA